MRTANRHCSAGNAKQQLVLGLPLQRGWGGKRKGAGRPRKQERPGVPHGKRPMLAARHPVHVTMRVREHVWNLRSRRCFRIIEAVFHAIAARLQLRIVHFSVQGNHVHLIVEATDATVLGAGMKAVNVRLAKALNRMMNRRGAVFADRYHAHALRAPREVRNAIAYVLLNHRSHMARAGERTGTGLISVEEIPALRP